MVSVGDRVTVSRIEERTVRISGGNDPTIPLDAASNTAGAGLLALIAERELDFGFEVSLEKGIPLGSGMGGSAASAAGAIVAASRLVPGGLTEKELLRYGMIGEEVATNSFHPDNLAPCILGGLVIAFGGEAMDVLRVPVPPALYCVVVHPNLRLDTRDARRVLPEKICLHQHVEQSGHLAGVIAGCFTGDFELIGRSLKDVIVEPKRSPLVAGFQEVQRAALEGGALGCSLSGSGPSLFAWCEGRERGEEIRERMVAAFTGAGVESRGWVSVVDAPGTRIESEG